MATSVISRDIGVEDSDQRAVPQLWRLVALGLVLALSAYTCLILNEHAGGISIIWTSNALLLGVLLLSPLRQWLAYIMVAYAVDVSVNLALSGHVNDSYYIALCNLVEVLVSAGLLRRVLPSEPDLTQRGQMARFLLFGALLPTIIATCAAMVGLQQLHSPNFLRSCRQWLTADVLGIATITPLCLAYRQQSNRWKELLAKGFFPFLFLIAVTAAVFWQTSFPFLFLVVPCLLLLGLRTGLTGSALGLVTVSFLGGFLTTASHGPIALMTRYSSDVRIVTFQFFIASSMIVLYLLELSMAENKRLQRSLRASEAYFRLIAETSRDIIVLTDMDGTRQYVSPSSYELLGWSPEELLGGNYRQLVHPDDVDALSVLLDSARFGEPESFISYRCRRKDGTYLWMEANLRLYRDSMSSRPVGFVNVVRDISSRKAAEDELTKAFQLVENLASIDGLTGIANRRRLDEVLEQEWKLAIRNHRPISLLLIDVDHFKEFNDHYGHLRGDECLREIARIACDQASRPTDLAARYGGEEFALVFPNTPLDGAARIAEQMRSAVQALNFPHAASPEGVVTVSIGCSTITPLRESTSGSILSAADAALYQAKRDGRNRVQVSQA